MYRWLIFVCLFFCSTECNSPSWKPAMVAGLLEAPTVMVSAYKTQHRWRTQIFKLFSAATWTEMLFFFFRFNTSAISWWTRLCVCVLCVGFHLLCCQSLQTFFLKLLIRICNWQFDFLSKMERPLQRSLEHFVISDCALCKFVLLAGHKVIQGVCCL